MKIRDDMWFQAEFNCYCGSRIEIRTYQAIVQGPGLEIYCRHCRQGYIITKGGATPITKGLSEAIPE